MNKELEYTIKNIIKESIDNVYFLNESLESKSISAAKKLLKLKYADRDPNELIDSIRSMFPILRTKTGGKFIEGTTRLLITDDVPDDIQVTFNQILNYIVKFKYDNYDRNFNDLSYKQLLNEINDDYLSYLNNKQHEIRQTKYTKPNDNYEVVLVHTPAEAHRLVGDYCDWCIASNEFYKIAIPNWNSYTSYGKSAVFFIMHKDFKNISKVAGNNTPYDDYGLSLICVIIDDKKLLVSCTLRWNHDNGCNDLMLDEELISKLIGINFYDAFNYNFICKDFYINHYFSKFEYQKSIKDNTFKLNYTELFKYENISFYYSNDYIDKVIKNNNYTLALKNILNKKLEYFANDDVGELFYRNLYGIKRDIFKNYFPTYDTYDKPFAIYYNNDNNKFLIIYMEICVYVKNNRISVSLDSYNTNLAPKYEPSYNIGVDILLCNFFDRNIEKIKDILN